MELHNKLNYAMNNLKPETQLFNGFIFLINMSNICFYIAKANMV